MQKPHDQRHTCRPLSMLLMLVVLSGAASAQEELPKSWLDQIDMYGNHVYQVLSIRLNGDNLQGTLNGDPLVGTIDNGKIHFVARDKQKTTYELNGTVDSNQIIGSLTITDSASPNLHVEHEYVAHPLPERPAGPPRLIQFIPTTFANRFSADIPSVMTIWPGDTIRTMTIDSGGVDQHGLTRAQYGNPQTGPFYVGARSQAMYLQCTSNV